MPPVACSHGEEKGAKDSEAEEPPTPRWGGVADTPALCKLGLDRGSESGGAELDAALNAFAWEMGGNDDLHATARYRRELVRRLAPGLIAEALQRRASA